MQCPQVLSSVPETHPDKAHKAPTQRESWGVQALALHVGHLSPSGAHCRTAAPTRSVLEGRGAEPRLQRDPPPPPSSAQGSRTFPVRLCGVDEEDVA